MLQVKFVFILEALHWEKLYVINVSCVKCLIFKDSSNPLIRERLYNDVPFICGPRVKCTGKYQMSTQVIEFSF